MLGNTLAIDFSSVSKMVINGAERSSSRVKFVLSGSGAFAEQIRIGLPLLPSLLILNFAFKSKNFILFLNYFDKN